jgi:hypothetical protein
MDKENVVYIYYRILFSHKKMKLWARHGGTHLCGRQRWEDCGSKSAWAEKLGKCYLKKKKIAGAVGHICNPSFIGGKGRRTAVQG